MKVLVVTNPMADASSAFGDVATELTRQLNGTSGVAAEILRLPCELDPVERWLDEIYIARSLRLTNVDRVVGLSFPANLVSHEHKVIWQISDDPCFATTGSGREDTIRCAISEAQNACYRAAHAIFAGSSRIRDQILAEHRIESELLPPPSCATGEPGRTGRALSDSASVNWSRTIERLLA